MTTVDDRIRSAVTAPGDTSVSGPVRARRHRLRALRMGIAATDAGLLLAAITIAWVLRVDPDEVAFVAGIDTRIDYLVVTTALAVVWMTGLSVMRTRDERVVGVGHEEYRRVVIASLAVGAVVATVSFGLQLTIARSYVGLAFPLGIIGLCCGRAVWRAVLVRSRASGGMRSAVLVVGDPTDIEYVTRKIIATPAAGYVVRAAATDGRPIGSSVAVGDERIPVGGSVADVVATAARTGVDAVVLAGALDGGRAAAQRLGWDLEVLGIELVVSSPLVDVAEGRIYHRPVDGLPLLHVELPRYDGVARAAKRCLDIVAAGLGLLVLAPLLAAVAVGIKLDDGGPVFFRQTRIGRRGRTFRIVKFRTMRVDAEQHVGALLELNEGAGPLFKMREDPRITRFGARLRRRSIDELPQLWNVLVGDMSLVGPRPGLPREVALYEDFADRRLLVLPGITGLWQISGRSDLDWADGLRLDLHYVENWSFVGDLVILARTVPSVLRSRGAY